MGKRDERIDAYIENSAEFARPILKFLREAVHEACPDVEETWKWSFPHFDYHGILCSMAAFKQHCTFGFWKASLMSDPQKILSTNGETAMGQFGKIQSLNDVPPRDVLISYIREAAQLNKNGVKASKPKMTTEKKELNVPEYFANALSENKKASETFENFNYSCRKEYVEWITEAKTEETRNKRLETALEWMAEGKTRHWKYARK